MALTKPQGDMMVKLGTSVASGSGTTVTFTGIPAGTTQVVVEMSGMSCPSAEDLVCQIGYSGGMATSGYLGLGAYVSTSSSVGLVGSGNTGAYAVGGGSTTNKFHGTFTWTLQKASTNLWVCTVNTAAETHTTEYVSFGGWSIALSGVLDRVQLRGHTGAASFGNDGVINIAYF